MAESVRNICKRSALARNIADEIRQFTVRQLTRRLRENNLSTRGLTSDFIDRLITYDISMLVPGANVIWSDEVDWASDIELEPADEA